jgi:hypothetical protein
LTNSNSEIPTINNEILNDEYFYGDIYANTYGDQYTTKIKEIKRCILDIETGEGKFKILNTEASLGKSLNTNKIIKKYLKDTLKGKRKFLIVKRFVLDIERDSLFIGEDMNSYFGTDILGITSVNWSEWKEKLEVLPSIQVIFITHQRYIGLCEDAETRKYFEKGRHTLIIDEKVDFPVYTFSKKTYEDIQALLPFGLENDLSEVCKPLKDMYSFFYNDLKTRHECIFCKPKVNKKLFNKFKKSIQDNKNNIERLNDVKDFIKSLEILYSSRCIYNGGRISTLSKNHFLWGLKNNIILDASSGIDYVYRLSDKKYTLNRQSRVVDDSKMNIYPIEFNTSKTKIRENKQEFFREILEMVKAKTKKEDKVLIVCHKENAKDVKNKLVDIDMTDVEDDDHYVDEQIAINWFGNVIGKNTYKDFNTCWILGKPNLPLESYLIHYMHYSQIDHLGRKPMTTSKGKFDNQTFRDVQDGEIASDVYQCIKRIQRNANPEGDIYIVLDDEIILNKVISDMKNPKVHKATKMKFNVHKNVKDKEDRVDEIVEYFKNLQSGVYTKKEICEKLALGNAHLYRYLNNVKVKNLQDTKIIKIEPRCIIRF